MPLLRLMLPNSRLVAFLRPSQILSYIGLPLELLWSQSCIIPQNSQASCLRYTVSQVIPRFVGGAFFQVQFRQNFTNTPLRCGGSLPQAWLQDPCWNWSRGVY